MIIIISCFISVGDGSYLTISTSAVDLLGCVGEVEEAVSVCVLAVQEGEGGEQTWNVPVLRPEEQVVSRGTIHSLLDQHR